MNKVVAFLLVLLITAPAMAVDHGHTMYVGGTVSVLKSGLVGRLDTTSEKSLAFEYASGKLEIPYTAVDHFQYTTQLTHHLGVLPAIAVGLLRKRKHRHFFQISFRDTNQLPQVVVFEVAKDMPSTLQAILTARAQECTRASRN